MASSIRSGSLKVNAQIAAILDLTRNDGSVQVDDYSAIGKSVNVPSDANLLYHQKVTVTAGSNATVDLSGSLTNALGEACVFAKVYAIMIINLNTVSGDYVDVGNSNFATWLGSATDTVKVGPKGVLLVTSPVDGHTVTASTGDILKIAAPGSNNVNVHIVVLGKS